jgi:hypothetical protein
LLVVAVDPAFGDLVDGRGGALAASTSLRQSFRDGTAAVNDIRMQPFSFLYAIERSLSCRSPPFVFGRVAQGFHPPLLTPGQTASHARQTPQAATLQALLGLGRRCRHGPWKCLSSRRHGGRRAQGQRAQVRPSNR